MWTLMRDYASSSSADHERLSPRAGDNLLENARARVLIVEEAQVASVAARTLANAGCDSETAGTGSAALNALGQRGRGRRTLRGALE